MKDQDFLDDLQSVKTPIEVLEIFIDNLDLWGDPTAGHLTDALLKRAVEIISTTRRSCH